MTQTEPGFDASRTAQTEPSPYRMGFPQDDAGEGAPRGGGFPAWLLAALISIVVSVGVVLILYYALIKPNINDEVKRDVAALGGTTATASSSSSSQQIVGTLPPSAPTPVSAGTGNVLGDPTSFRLTASVAQGQSTSLSNPPAGSVVTIPSGAVLSITDVIFSNPNGDAGTVELRQNGKALLSFQLANFRDQDYHFVAPLTFTAGQTLQLFVTCSQVGSGPPGGTVPSTCNDSLVYSGFQKSTS